MTHSPFTFHLSLSAHSLVVSADGWSSGNRSCSTPWRSSPILSSGVVLCRIARGRLRWMCEPYIPILLDIDSSRREAKHTRQAVGPVHYTSRTCGSRHSTALPQRPSPEARARSTSLPTPEACKRTTRTSMSHRHHLCLHTHLARERQALSVVAARALQKSVAAELPCTRATPTEGGMVQWEGGKEVRGDRWGCEDGVGKRDGCGTGGDGCGNRPACR
jgi:hypothetical protein